MEKQHGVLTRLDEKGTGGRGRAVVGAGRVAVGAAGRVGPRHGHGAGAGRLDPGRAKTNRASLVSRSHRPQADID